MDLFSAVLSGQLRFGLSEDFYYIAAEADVAGVVHLARARRRDEFRGGPKATRRSAPARLALDAYGDRR